MVIYVIILVITIFGALFFDLNTRHKKGKNFLWCLIFVILTLTIGLRYCVGGDTINYMGYWAWYPKLDKWEITGISLFEPGFSLLFSGCKSLSDQFYVFQLIHALIINTLLFIFIKRYTNNIFSSLIAIFFTCYLYFTTEILREVLAVLIFVLNYTALKDGKWIKYYLGVFLSCLFHISAIFLIIIPLFRKLKLNRGYLVVLLSTLIGLIFLRGFLSSLTGVTLISSKLLSYMSDTSHGMLADFLNLCSLTILPLLFCLLVKYGCRQTIKFEMPILIMSLLGICAYMNPIIFSRAANYFLLFYSLSIADFCVNAIKSNNRVLRQYGIMITFIFFVFYVNDFRMYRKYTRWVPYYSILNPVEVNRNNYGD